VSHKVTQTPFVQEEVTCKEHHNLCVKWNGLVTQMSAKTEVDTQGIYFKNKYRFFRYGFSYFRMGFWNDYDDINFCWTTVSLSVKKCMLNMSNMDLSIKFSSPLKWSYYNMIGIQSKVNTRVHSPSSTLSTNALQSVWLEYGVISAFTSISSGILSVWTYTNIFFNKFSYWSVGLYKVLKQWHPN